MFAIKIIDISICLDNDTKVFAGDPRVTIEQHSTIEDDGFAVTLLTMGSHSGTHVDAPSHVMDGGRNVAEIPLSALLGACALVEKGALKVPAHCKRVLIKTGEAGPANLSEKQARQLVDAGVRLVGTDALSIGNDKVHQILLGEGCLILEALDLQNAEPGSYFLCAMPLKIKADGAPARVCLIENIGK